MNRPESWWQRLAFIISLVERAPHQTLGRTAIVKMAYLLQVLRGVPLGYHFSLYTYGPFDAKVLDDLAYAQALKAVEVRIVEYGSGYGYNVCPGPKAEVVKAQAGNWLERQQTAIAWVVEKFAGYTASELELLATIVYTDRELSRDTLTVTAEELAHRVREVKPRCPESYVLDKTNSLLDRGMLTSVKSGPHSA
jgi:hypothetical protein